MSNVIPLSRFRSDISKSGAQLLREITASSDLIGEVHKLDPLELFSVVLDVGEDEAMALLAVAEPEQLRRLVDLTLGRTDEPDFRGIDRLINAALHHGHGTVLFNKLDEEMQTLYLYRRIRVLDAPKNGDDLPDAAAKVERLLTPDGTFVIEVALPEGDDEVDASLPDAANEVPKNQTSAGFSALPLIADLYATDWQRADTIMRDVMHVIAAELEEEIVRVRDARLEEMGFPPREDAWKLFARRVHTTLAPRGAITAPRTSLPTAYAEPFLADSFLLQALTEINDADLLGQIESELVYLTNADCVVKNRLYGESESVREAARDVRNVLSLSLEVATAGDAAAATQLLRAHPLRELFSFGMEQSYKLGDWAKKADAQHLFKLPGLKRRALSAEDEHFLRALLQAFPRYVEHGLEPSRAFASRKEIALAHKRLDALGRSLVGLRSIARSVDDFGRVLARTDPDAASVTAEQLLRSALVRRAIGASLRDTLAVSSADLRAFRAQTSTAWPEELLGPTPAEVAPALQAVWTHLVAEVQSLGESPDPRFVNLITGVTT